MMNELEVSPNFSVNDEVNFQNATVVRDYSHFVQAYFLLRVGSGLDTNVKGHFFVCQQLKVSCRWLLRSAGVLRVEAYNLLSATAALRLRDVSSVLNADLIGLAGTRLWHCGRHFKAWWRYCNTKFSNRSASETILLNSKKWQTKHVTRVPSTPSSRSVQGRVGAGRLQRGKMTSLQR